ncbi:fatty acid desaturase [Dyella sp. RRB7]|uniref:DesA family fatty acid desaturase n=1 Tax=Dyella sp. RRB7 TaxID=2919502 RepID=UPI001FA95DBB|nr:fatty acid desaturase [Dyella sp. RRB7]
MFDRLLDLASHGLLHAGLGVMLVYLLVMTQLTILTVTLYLHRSQTHRSVDFHPALAHAFRFWSWLTTAMVTRDWVAVHRKHHAYADTGQDPHSPYIVGIHSLLWRGTELYTAARQDRQLLATYGRGTPDDWIERHLYTPHCNWGPTLLAVISLALFGVGGMAIWAVQMMWIPFWGAGVVNGIGHWWGYRNFETPDKSANMMPLAIWVGGEELHNNHHAFPSSAKFSVRRFEFDAGWLVIQTLSLLGLARVRRIAVAEQAHMAAGTARAVALSPRVKVMTEFFRKVTLPVVRDEARRQGSRHPKLAIRLRRALADGGRWLSADERERLNAWIETQPCLRTICQLRGQLAALMEMRNAERAAEALSQWVRAAQASGIGALQRFALSLSESRAVPRAPLRRLGE